MTGLGALNNQQEEQVMVAHRRWGEVGMQRDWVAATRIAAPAR